MTRATAWIFAMLLLVFTSSQAALVTTHLGTSVSTLESFHEFNFPPDPAIGTQVTEVFGAHLVQTNTFVTVLYDPAFFSVQTTSNYHTETATVGTRLHEYVGFFDPVTNELQSATWQVIAENIFEENFQVGASSQFLQQTGGGGPGDPPPPPPQIVPLPPTALLLGPAMLLAALRRRHSAARLTPSSWSPDSRVIVRRS